MKLIKFKRNDSEYPEYGVVEDDKVKIIKDRYIVSDIFQGLSDGTISTENEIGLNDINPLPPTDENVHIFCAGLNYLDHAEELRMPPPKTPIFFTKPGSALNGPNDDIIYPEATQLLDYEIELAIVLGKGIGFRDTITPENLSDYILGISIFNDISARDLQLASGQWFMGKCFRTFAPLGPYLQVFDSRVSERLYNLDLKLNVLSENGTEYHEKKQMGNTGRMIFKIDELINSLREKFTLNPGDIIATGTPAGVALSRPSRIKSRLAEIIGMPASKRIEKFIRDEIKGNIKYLEEGDVIISSISSSDGLIDLGRQRNRVIKIRND